MFTNFVHVFAPTEENYLVIQKHSEVWLYNIHLGRPELSPEEEETNLGALVEDICVV